MLRLGPLRRGQCSCNTRSPDARPASNPPSPTAVSKCIQLSITCEDAAALTLLRDRINRVLLKHAGAGGTGGGSSSAAACAPAAAKPGLGKPGAKQNRRPLAPRSLNTLGAGSGPAPSSSGWGGGSVVSLRSGLGGSAAMGPATSGFSLGAAAGVRAALASSAESSAASGGEDLAALSEEQQRALQLVRSGRSIFFTGAPRGVLWLVPCACRAGARGSQACLRLLLPTRLPRGCCTWTRCRSAGSHVSSPHNCL